MNEKAIEAALSKQFYSRLRGPDGGVQIFINELPKMAKEIAAALPPLRAREEAAREAPDELSGLKAKNAALTDIAKALQDALTAIKTRIGDLEKLSGDDKAQGRKWALEAIWDIAHNITLSTSADAIFSRTAEPKWRDISSAPTTEWILGWRPGSIVRDMAWLCLPPAPGYWTGMQRSAGDIPPTHWMPLPAPPVAEPTT